MWYCNNCESSFDDPDVLKTTYEALYGVSSEFPNSTPVELDICPYCGSENVEEYDEDEEGEE